MPFIRRLAFFSASDHNMRVFDLRETLGNAPPQCARKRQSTLQRCGNAGHLNAHQGERATEEEGKSASDASKTTHRWSS